MRDLDTRALYKISSQDLYERSLDKSSLRSPDIPGLPRSFHRSSLQDLSTRPLWEISIQELTTRSLHRTHLFSRSPDIPGPLRSPHRISLQDLFKIGTALQREQSDTHGLRRGLHESRKEMLQAERQRHSVSKMSTALQPERSDTRKVPRGLRLQTLNRHCATARLNKSQFVPQLDVNLPIRFAIF